MHRLWNLMVHILVLWIGAFLMKQNIALNCFEFPLELRGGIIDAYALVCGNPILDTALWYSLTFIFNMIITHTEIKKDWYVIDNISISV